MLYVRDVYILLYYLAFVLFFLVPRKGCIYSGVFLLVPFFVKIPPDCDILVCLRSAATNWPGTDSKNYSPNATNDADTPERDLLMYERDLSSSSLPFVYLLSHLSFCIYSVHTICDPDHICPVLPNSFFLLQHTKKNWQKKKSMAKNSARLLGWLKFKKQFLGTIANISFSLPLGPRLQRIVLLISNLEQLKSMRHPIKTIRHT